jgi:ATP-dependent RNA helicase DDX52/ROK1
MDLFKVLSRSTKLQKAGSKTSKPQTLPSTGQRPNPQIFGREDPVDSECGLSSGKTALGKRKRGDGRAAQESNELDFFAEKRSTKQDRKSNRRAEITDAGEIDGAELLADSISHIAAENGDVEEQTSLESRKRVLKLHKVKITKLAGSQKHENEVKPQKSKPLDQNKREKEKSSIYPRPLESFKQLRSRFGIDRMLADNIQEQGYTTPTEVQLASLPLLLGDSLLDADGHQTAVEGASTLLVVAPTGSGKTLAFLIPIINDLLQTKRREHSAKFAQRDSTGLETYLGPQAVILAPTKELTNQIVNEGRKLASGTKLRITLMRKDMTFASIDANEYAEGLPNNVEDKDALPSDEDLSDNDGAFGRKVTKTRARQNVPKSDIVVATPLSLLHALEISKKRAGLPSVQYLVLDEADVLLDPLFREQTLDIWHACTNSQLSVSLWSATMASSIETLALEEITSAGIHGSVLRLVVGIKDTALPTITHNLTYAATETGKLLAMRQLLHPTSASTDSEGRKSLRPPFLVFTQTIPRATALQAELKYDIPPEAGGSSRIAVLHSGLSDFVRSRVMAGFRRGDIWVIITTDLLARGVDFRGLNGVVNYDVPTSAAAYVHRVGRTGRAGREGGVSVTFYTKEDIPHVKAIANVIAASEKLRKKKDGDSVSSVQQWLLDALPTPSKREKKELKKRGVESRRVGVESERISTKSSYDRRRESMRRASKRSVPKKDDDAEFSEFEGFD